MSPHKVLLLGATGETGGDILDALVKDPEFEVTCLVRPASVDSPKVKALKDRGLKLLVVDITQSPEKVAPSLKGYETIISTVGAFDQLQQLNLVEAISKVPTVKRFVPCGFMTIAPRGTHLLRDQKEEVHDLIFKHKIPYTIIDVGYWHQLSFPRLTSGKVDYAMISLRLQPPQRFAGGKAKNLLTDKRDIGNYTARIIKDPRTINKRVFTWSDTLDQKEIFALMEKVSGEKVADIVEVSAEKLLKLQADSQTAYKANPTDMQTIFDVIHYDYDVTKYVQEYNTPEYAEYLGYLDAKKLYPDFQPVSFESYLRELLAGKGKKSYEGRF